MLIPFALLGLALQVAARLSDRKLTTTLVDMMPLGRDDKETVRAGTARW